MTSRQLKVWAWLHKWTSLVCTLFMMLLCLTGLPLIFHHEIGHLLGTEVEPVSAPAGTPHVSYDDMLKTAQARHPDRIIQYSSPHEDTTDLWFFTLTHTPAPTDDFRKVAIDAPTGKIVAEPRIDTGFMWVMLRLHVDLFADLPGKLFLGFMGFLLAASIVSGMVLYAPFMRKLEFGQVRRDRSPRAKWLDIHNLLGIVTLVWALVVSLTGVMNTLADVMISHWQDTEIAPIVAPYKNLPVIAVGDRTSVQKAMKVALAHTPGKKVDFIAYPGTIFSSPHHITFYMRGTEPLTSRLLQPVMIDARTAEVTASPSMPWYLTAMLLSQPLHFGDYGGMPMQILWAVFDIVTIVVLGSGLYLWYRRRAVAAPAMK